MHFRNNAFSGRKSTIIHWLDMQAYILLRTFFKEAFLYKTAAMRYEMSRNEAMEGVVNKRLYETFLKIQGSYKHPLINLLPDTTLVLK